MNTERKIKGYNLNELGRNNGRYALPETITLKQFEDGKPYSGIFYDPQFEEQYKQGEWRFGISKGCQESRVFHIGKDCIDYIVWGDGMIDDAIYPFDEIDDGEIATEEQLLSHLSAAAVKKGYVKGVRVAFNIENEKYDDILTKSNFHLKSNALWCNSDGFCVALIFDLNTPQWAEIIEQPKEVEQPQQEFESSEKRPYFSTDDEFLPVSITSITLSNGKTVTAEQLNKL